MGCSKSGIQKEIYTFKFLYQKKKSTLNLSKRQKIIKISTRIHEKNDREKSMNSKVGSKTLTNLTNFQPDEDKKKTQIMKIRNKRGDTITKPYEIKRIIRETVNNFMPIHLAIQIKGQVPRKSQIVKTDSVRTI